MAGYLGNTQKISGRYTVDEFTSSGGTTYTLGSAPGDKNNIINIINKLKGKEYGIYR